MELFTRYTAVFPAELPADFLIRHLAGSFAETVKWWVSRDMAPEPEVVASYFMMAVGKNPADR